MLFRSRINNLYTLKLTNKTQHDIPVELKLENIDGTLIVSGSHAVVRAGKQIETSVLIQIAPDKLTSASTPVVVGVYVDGQRTDTLKTSFLGPRK